MSGCNDRREPVVEMSPGFGRDQRGVALLTVIMVMLILTTLGVAAMTVSGLENNIAGIQRRTEAASIAVESCVGIGANILEQTIIASSVPAAFTSTATPAGPVPASNLATLEAEIMGQSDNNADDPAVVPNMSLQVGAYAVAGDIDRLYAKGISGGSQVFAGAYEGYGQGAGAGGIEIHYRISCLATDIATGTNTHTTAVYGCVMAGEGCQRKL